MRILLISYDNGSHIHFFPLGVAYIASVLLREGHEVEIYNQDMNHYPDEHLTDYLDKNKFDVVGIGVVGGYYQYRKLLKISEAINKSKNRPFYMIGGHGPSPEPEYFLKKTGADVAIIGEGEETVVHLMTTFANNKPLNSVKGIAYCEGGQVFVNERRPLIEDLSTIPFPAYELFPVDYYRLKREINMAEKDFLMPIITGRGCPFSCSFCYRMDSGFRPRTNEDIIEEIKYLKQDYRINYFFFTDELLMVSEKRVRGLCEDFIRQNLDIKWNCNGRLNFAKPELLKLMKRARCVLINYGVEAVDNEVLVKMNKALTVDVIIKGVEATQESGISQDLNIIFGNIGDNKGTLGKGVDFLIKYDDGGHLRTIRPVTPYPGSPLYYYAIEKGLLKDCEDFYENKHLNSDLLAVNFTEMSDDEFHKALLDANTKLIKNYYKKKIEMSIQGAEKLYLKGDTHFRGFRDV